MPRTSSVHIKQVIEALTDLVVVIDREGVIEEVNHAFEVITGLGREEAIGSPITLLRSGDCAPEFFEQLWQTTLANERYRGEIIHRTRDGTVHHLLTTIIPIVDENQETTQFLAVGRDDTERRELEQRLHHAQRLEVVGLLASGVAHDFNNILTAIFGYCALLGESLPNDPLLEADLSEIVRAAKRAALLIRQLLAFSRNQVIQPQAVDVNAVIGELLRMLEQVLGKDLELHFEPAEGLSPASVDPTQLEQIVVNLALNARDAMPYGGRLTVSTGHVTLDPVEAKHAEALPGQYIRLIVEDTGRGMDSRTLRRIYEPFFSTKPTEQGGGLGLATCHDIVRRCGGFIHCRSAPGQGTRFSVHLPQASEAVSEQAPPDSIEQHAGSETILLVEDDSAVRASVQRALEQVGYDVTSVKSANTALRLIRQGVSYCLLLTDIVLPQINGMKMVIMMRELGTVIPVLMMTGGEQQELERRLELDPGIPILNKPFTIDSLMLAVRQALDVADRAE